MIRTTLRSWQLLLFLMQRFANCTLALSPSQKRHCLKIASFRSALWSPLVQTMKITITTTREEVVMPATTTITTTDNNGDARQRWTSTAMVKRKHYHRHHYQHHKSNLPLLEPSQPQPISLAVCLSAWAVYWYILLLLLFDFLLCYTVSTN